MPHPRDLFDYYGFKCQAHKKFNISCSVCVYQWLVIAVRNKIQYRKECEPLDLDLGDQRASNYVYPKIDVSRRKADLSDTLPLYITLFLLPSST